MKRWLYGFASKVLKIAEFTWENTPLKQLESRALTTRHKLIIIGGVLSIGYLIAVGNYFFSAGDYLRGRPPVQYTEEQLAAFKAANQGSSARVLPAEKLDSDANQAINFAKQLNSEKFGEHHWESLYNLWYKESTWNAKAVNPTSGACGIPQALPCAKISDRSMPGQIEWGLSYIQHRYGNPTEAWRFWRSNNWY